MTFLDADVPAALATVLHTAGAIGYLAGIGAFLAWRQHLLAGNHQRGVLALAAAVTYISILANLLGGFMRTYQTGHPSLTQVMSEPWAALMVIKHVALFAGIFGAAYLLEVAAPRMIRAQQQGRVLPTAKPVRWAVAGVVISVFVASLLGAAATVVDIGPPADMDDEPNPGPVVQTFAPKTYTFEGQSSANAPATGIFGVDAGATQVEAYLYTSQVAGESPFAFTLTLTAPDGTQTTASSNPGTPNPLAPEYNTDVTVRAPVTATGDWSYQVSTQAGLAATWDLTLSVTGPEGLVLANTIVLDGGFYEINTVMEQGNQLHWDWSTADGTAIHFDVHRHVGGQTQYDVDGDFSESNETYTAAADGGVSLLWQNNGSEPVTLTYRVWGDFTLHSIFD